jgi:tyrosine-protein kinase Etk/Wzc
MDSQTSIRDDLRGAARVLWKKRTRVFLVTSVTVLTAIVMSLIVPHVYEARATFLATEDDQSSLAGQLAMAGALVPAGILGSSSAPVEVYREILESRAVREGVVESLRLVERFGLAEEQPQVAHVMAVDAVGSMVRIADKRSGWMAVETKVSTPWFPFLHEAADDSAKALASRMANEMVRQLNVILRERRSSSARNSRVYLEDQLEKNKEALEVASDSLVAFQKRHATISIEEQARVSLETLGELKGQIVAKEVERDVLRRNRSGDSFDLQRVESELRALEERYDALVRGAPTDPSATSSRALDSGVPLDQLPELAAELFRRQKEVQLQHTVYELLTQQYYHALLEEARDTPTVQPLDEALPPLGKSSPKRKLIVIVAALAGGILGCVWVLIADRPRAAETVPARMVREQR